MLIPVLGPSETFPELRRIYPPLLGDWCCCVEINRGVKEVGALIIRLFRMLHPQGWDQIPHIFLGL